MFSDGFEGEQVLLTSVALERKYLLGEIIEQCYELLDTIEVYVDYFFPYAQHGALLYSVIQRINLLSQKNYYFSINIIYNLFDELFPINNQTSDEDKLFWKDIEDKRKLFVYLFIYLLNIYFYLFIKKNQNILNFHH